MQRYLEYLLHLCRKEEEKKPGCESQVIKPRAFVIRIPSAFVGMSNHVGGFQTVVVAKDADNAWDVAADVDTWEILDFEVEDLHIFPKNPR